MILVQRSIEDECPVASRALGRMTISKKEIATSELSHIKAYFSQKISHCSNLRDHIVLLIVVEG